MDFELGAGVLGPKLDAVCVGAGGTQYSSFNKNSCGLSQGGEQVGYPAVDRAWAACREAFVVHHDGFQPLLE